VTALHDGRRRVVGAVDPAAAALGLRPGMALAHAVALAPGLRVVEAEPEGDADALRRLAAWCHRLAPLTAPDPPDGLWLDVTGCTHLFRGAVADTPGAAHAVARHGPGGVVPVGQHAEAIAALPLAALRLVAELVTTLHRLGFDRVAHLDRLPRATLARRFGPHLLLRLD